MLNEPIPPLLVISSCELAQDGKSSVMIKGFVSSLLRSLYGGRMVVFRNHEMPVFKVERKEVDEVFVTATRREKPGAGGRSESMEFLLGLGKLVKPELRQWVIFADTAGLALRNIDHLLPPDQAGPYSPPEVDFYLASANGTDEVTPGIWAVRGEHLPMVLERWKCAWNELGNDAMLTGAAVWSRVVRELPLRKKQFEKGEVYAPKIGLVDWEALSNAAFVTVPDWPVDEQRKFLQTLYFGTYFGDETGMMLNIFEA